MIYLLDTKILIDLIKNQPPEVAARVDEDRMIAVQGVSLSTRG